MPDLNIVAHMMCRNEFDVIEETISEIFRWVDTLVVLDGGSDDGTWSFLRDLSHDYKSQSKRLAVYQEPDEEDRFTDHGPRTRLLELSAQFNPDWIISVDADEIYHYDPGLNIFSPVDAIYEAHGAGANVVRCYVPQFWLTFQDLREGALNEDETISVQERRRWYSWGHMGTFIWRWNPQHYYPKDTPKRTPELPGKTWREWQLAGDWHPVCKHYCFRSLRQGLNRAEERRERGGRQYFGKYFQNWIVDEQLAELHYLDDPENWQYAENHDRVCAYMAGKIKAKPGDAIQLIARSTIIHPN